MLFDLCSVLRSPDLISNQPLYLVLHAFLCILIEMHPDYIGCTAYLLS